MMSGKAAIVAMSFMNQVIAQIELWNKDIEI